MLLPSALTAAIAMGRVQFVLSFCNGGGSCDDEIVVDNKDQKQIIQLQARLLPLIQFDKMVPFLIQKGIISGHRASVIERKGREWHAAALLNHLSHPDVTSLQLDSFIECLIETGHGDAAELIRPAADVSSFGSSSSSGSLVVSEPHLLVKRTTAPRSGSSYYKMSSQPRGYWIIVNIYQFEGKPQKTRLGSDKDAARMQEIGSELGFDARLETDLTVDEIQNLLMATAEDPALARHDALVVLIMSHGECDTIKGTDWRDLHIHDVRKYFSSEQCPLLVGKPKVFIFVSCRGNDNDGPRDLNPCTDHPESFHSVLERSSGSSGRVSVPPPHRLIDETLTAYSTSPGFVSHRHPEEGSYYITALARVLMEHSCHMHLLDMLRKVDEEMSHQVIGEEYMQTPGVELNGFNKKLYFNPGHYDDPDQST